MEEKKITTYKIAAVYIGTVVGAGFASGQEILQFFAVFGIKGLLGLMSVIGLFIYFGYKIMLLGRRLRSNSHEPIVQYACGNFLGRIIDFIITFFLFGSLTAMIAGTGAIFNQIFHVPQIYGNLIMLLAAVLTLMTGMNGVINSISIAVPFLLISTVGISIASYLFVPMSTTEVYVNCAYSGSLISSWWMSAILYTSYNIILSIAILVPLGRHAKDKKTIQKGAILGGLGLGVGAIAIFFAVYRNLADVRSLEIPFIYIANKLSPTVQWIYVIVLVAEIYSTAVSSLFGLVTRLTDSFVSNQKKTIVLLAFSAFFASQVGFSNLVRYFYPIIGYCGVLLLISLTYVKTPPFTKA